MFRGVATADEVRPEAPDLVRADRARWPRLRSSLRGRLSLPDPLIGVVGLVSLGVYLLHGFDRAVTRDLGLYLYGGQRFLDGEPPYVGVINRAGPLAHVLPGIGIGLGRLVGMSDIRGARVFFMLLAVACICLAYVLVRDLTGSRSAALVAAAAFLSFDGFLDLATYGPREKTPMVLFSLALLLAVRHRRWATAGVFIALATLTWQPVFFGAVLLAVVAAVLAPERRLAAVARIFIGGAAVSAVVLVYYALNGALDTFFDGFVLINAQYTKQTGAFTGLHSNWASLERGFGISVWAVLFGLAALPVAAVVSVRAAWKTHEAQVATYAALGIGWLGGVVWSVVAFNGWPDLFVLLPFIVVGIGWAAALVLRLLDRFLDRRVVVVLAVVLALVGTAKATDYSVTTRQHDLKTQEASIAAVLAAGPQPSTILSMEAPQVLVISHRLNPTPYQMFDHGFPAYVDATYPGGLHGYKEMIKRTDPTYIVVSPRWKPAWFLPWLKRHYESVGVVRRIRWWVSNSVSPAVRQQIHAANRAAR